MNKLLAALITCGVATVAAAQSTTPIIIDKERQTDAKGASEAAASGIQAPKEEPNVKASKGKMTTAEKNKAIKDANAKMVNPSTAYPGNPTLRSFDDPRGKFGVDSRPADAKQGKQPGDPSRR